MIHHIDFAVADIERSREFYVRALAPLGLTMLMEFTLAMVAALARAMRHCSRLVHGV